MRSHPIINKEIVLVGITPSSGGNSGAWDGIGLIPRTGFRLGITLPSGVNSGILLKFLPLFWPKFI